MCAPSFGHWVSVPNILYQMMTGEACTANEIVLMLVTIHQTLMRYSRNDVPFKRPVGCRLGISLKEDVTLVLKSELNDFQWSKTRSVCKPTWQEAFQGALRAWWFGYKRLYTRDTTPLQAPNDRYWVVTVPPNCSQLEVKQAQLVIPAAPSFSIHASPATCNVLHFLEMLYRSL